MILFVCYHMFLATVKGDVESVSKMEKYTNIFRFQQSYYGNNKPLRCISKTIRIRFTCSVN